MLRMPRAEFRTESLDLSTGQVAKMLDVSSATILAWCNSGDLASHRIGTMLHRRITRPDLAAFLTARRLPIPAELRPVARKVMTVCLPDHAARSLATFLSVNGDFTVYPASSAFAAGILLATERPLCVLIDDSALGRIEAEMIADALADDPYSQGVTVLRVRECHGPLGVAVLAALAGGGA